MSGNTPITSIKNKTATAATIPSPIALDLDGDGVETLSTTVGPHFDHAADGFAERSGWIAPDDGLLVRDLNGNGRIDSGRELFGSETLLANGRKATHGFEALRELDTHNNQVIDAQDTAFAQLRIWQDVNSNGRAEAGELIALTEAGVQAIHVAYTDATHIDAQGNAHRQVASYTSTAGDTRAATDVWVKTDATHSVPTERVKVPEDIARLPDAQGAGKVRDLHQAMAMDATGTLRGLVTAFTQAPTGLDQDALVTQIIYHWTGVQNVDPASRASRMIYGNAIGDARKLEALEEFMGEEWVGVWCWGTRDPNPHGRAAPVLLQAWDELKGWVQGQLTAQVHLQSLLQQITFRWDDELDGLVADFSSAARSLSTQIQADRAAGLVVLSGFLQAIQGLRFLSFAEMSSLKTALVPLGQDVADTIEQALAGWKTQGTSTEQRDVLRGTTLADRLDGYGGDDKLFGRAGRDTLVGGTGNDVLDGGEGSDDLHGNSGSDTYRFGRGSGDDVLREDSWLQGETDRIELKAGVTPADVRLERVRAARGWQLSDDLKLTIRDTGETLTVRDHFNASKRHAVEAIAFVDGTVWDAEAIQSRVLLGEASDDEIQGFNARDDVLAGGPGQDVLRGGSGSDTYRFGWGDGQDAIEETTHTGHDLVALEPGITPADVMVRWTLQGDMTINLPDGTQLAIRDQETRWSDQVGVEALQFNDGTVWDRTTLASRAVAPTDGDDTLVIGYGDETLEGGKGNDLILSRGGDVFYRFGHGDGHDVIANKDCTLFFQLGIRQNDVSLKLDQEDLVVTLSASGDTIRIKDWLDGWGYRNVLIFDNGTQLDINAVKALLVLQKDDEILYGSPGEDTLASSKKYSTLLGGKGNDSLWGGAGHDTLDGEAGDDFLDGGPGRDTLRGAEGRNTYRMSPGMGLDTAIGARLEVANDTVVFASGLRLEDISVQLGWRSWGDDAQPANYHELVIGIGGNDALVVRTQDPIGLRQGAIQRFRFDDGTELSLSDLIGLADEGKLGWQRLDYDGPQEAAPVLGSHGDDSIYETSGLSNTVQSRGNDDDIYLGSGNNRVAAGSGHDRISTGPGDDLIAGEAGDDAIGAGGDDDTLVFNETDGHDTLSAGAGVDTLSFGAGITPSMLWAGLDSWGRVVLLVKGLASSGTIALSGASIHQVANDLERIQFIGPEGQARIFDLAGWLRANESALLEATVDAPLAFNGQGFELTGMVPPAGGLEAVAYAQTGDLFIAPARINNDPSTSDDLIYGTSAGDSIDAGGGNDIVLGISGADFLQGGDGQDLIAGGEGNDSLAGGSGSDTLLGGAGGDTYFYEVGHGEVTIDDGRRAAEGESLNGSWEGESFEDAWEGSAPVKKEFANILSFGPGIEPADLRYFERHGDLVIEIANRPGDRLLLRGYEPYRATQTRSVDVFRFADGSQRGSDVIDPLGQIRVAHDGGDWLGGSRFSDTLIGGTGDDVLYAQGGADLLAGGVGSDTYRIHKERLSRATETVVIETWRAQDINRIELTGDVSKDNLRLEFDGRDLLLRYTPQGDAIRFAGFDPRAPGMPAPVAEVMLSWSDVTVTFDELLARGIQQPDSIPQPDPANPADGEVAAGGLVIEGDAQANVLTGTDLSDTLRGAANDDVLQGGHGDDAYVFHKGDGRDVVIDSGANDFNYIRFAAGIRPEDIRREWDGTALVLHYTAEDSVRVPEFHSLQGHPAILSMVFEDGTVASLSEQMNRAPTVVRALDDIGAVAEKEFSLTLPADLFTDPDAADTLRVSVQAPGGHALPDWLRFDPVSQTLSGRPTREDVGSLALVVEGRDHFGAVASTTFGLAVARPPATEVPPPEVTKPDPVPDPVPDQSTVTEDVQLPVSGNVLDNDQAPTGKSLKLTHTGLQKGDYGTLLLREDGAFAYALDHGASGVQSLGQGESVVDRFTYRASDGTHQTLGTLAITVQGANDAPERAHRLQDVQLAKGKRFSWQVPNGSFIDSDHNDTLTYQATLADGKALPSWLKFNAATQTFSGTAPSKLKGDLEIQLVASDGRSAQSMARDVFKLSVGSKAALPSDDTQPGYGSGPSQDHPGRERGLALGHGNGQGNGRGHGRDHEDDSLDHYLDSYKSPGTNPSSGLSAAGRRWLDASKSMPQGPEDGGKAGGSADVERLWAQLADALQRLDAERQAAPAWSGANQGADVTSLISNPHRNSEGARRGVDAVSLAGGSTSLKGFTGLREGLVDLPW